MIDLHPPWAAYFAYALLVLMVPAAWYLLGSRRDARQHQRDTADALQREAVRHEAVLGAVSDAVIAIDEQQHIVLFNAAAQRMLMCGAAEALGTEVSRFVPPEKRDRHRELVRAFIGSGGESRALTGNRDMYALRTDGTRFPIEASLSRIEEPGPKGPRTLYTVLMRDITKRRRAEDALRDSEALHRAIFDQALVAIARTDRSGRVLDINPRFCSMLGYRQSALRDLSMMDLTHPDDRPRTQALFETLLQGGPPFTIEQRYLRKDGSSVWVENAVDAIRDSEGQVLAIVSSSVDVEARKRAVDALEHSREQLRRLSASLTRAREDERRHLSRELHDELGQRLSAIKMALASLTDVAPNTATLGQRIDSLLDTVDETIVSARRIAGDLRPTMLDDLGLNAALDWLVKDWSARAALQIRLEAASVDDRISDDASTAIYRIVQEALTNICRHARATRADIDLQCDGTDLRLVVQDDGRGLSPGDIDKRGSFGLLGIRERARDLGGSTDIVNATGGGCRLEIRLPLERIDSR